MEEKQMKTLGGYEIVDEKAREEINIVAEKADEAYSLAKGATKAFVYDTYSDMIAELNALDKAELLVNFHVMIREVCVPDLWISGVSDEHVEYTYTSNEDFIVDLTEDGVVQVGYFVLSALETQKVDLSEYVKKDDYATQNKVGLVYAHIARGISVLADGGLIIAPAYKSNVDGRSAYSPITGSVLDYAVKKALSDCKLTGDDVWTEEEKKAVRDLLNLVGLTDIASSNKPGLARIFGIAEKNVPGVGLNGNNILAIAKATDTEIEEQTNEGKPIVPSNLSHAIKVGLTDNKLEWTEEEKAKALELLGGLQKIASTGSFQRVYAIGQDGLNKPLNTSENPFSSALVLFDAGGCVKVNAPTKDNHATTKKYVDDLVGYVESILTELHTHAESLIGGDTQ